MPRLTHGPAADDRARVLQSAYEAKVSGAEHEHVTSCFQRGQDTGLDIQLLLAVRGHPDVAEHVERSRAGDVADQRRRAGCHVRAHAHEDLGKKGRERYPLP